MDEAELAAVAFLARYSGRTLEAYRQDLRFFFAWTASVGLEVLAATRPHIELFRHHIGDLGFDRGHRTVRIHGKGHKPAVIPLVPRTARTVDLAIGERREGPILIRNDANASTAAPHIVG